MKKLDTRAEQMRFKCKKHLKGLRQTLGRYRNYDPGTDELNQGGGAPQTLSELLVH